MSYTTIPRRPAASAYANLHHPLPRPPKGQAWMRDEQTREWKLVQQEEEEEEEEDANASPETTSMHHQVASTDTLQGICLRYGITERQLRQANGGFSGFNLSLAPSTLVIPSPKRGTQTPKDYLPAQKVEVLQRQYGLGSSEAKAYLELSDWDLEEAKKQAQDDSTWEAQEEKK